MSEVIDHGPIRELQITHPPVNALRPDVLASLRHALQAAPAEGAAAVVVSGAPLASFQQGSTYPSFWPAVTPSLSRPSKSSLL